MKLKHWLTAMICGAVTISALTAHEQYVLGDFSRLPMLGNLLFNGCASLFLSGLFTSGIGVVLDRLVNNKQPVSGISTMSACLERIGRIKDLKNQVMPCSSLSVNQQLETIVDRCYKTYDALKLDNKLQAAEQFLVDYLIPIQKWLETYARLKTRDLELAHDAIHESEISMLPLITTKLNAYYNQIHVTEIASLSTAGVALELVKTAEVRLEAEAVIRRDVIT